MNRGFLLRFVIVFAAVFGVIFLLVWFYLSVATTAQAGEPPQPSAITFARDTLTIRMAAGGEHDFRIEVAETGPQQRLGLMHRDHLAADAGMLFVYDPPHQVIMWMKNTRIPLDMLFAGANGTVFRIVENAVPYSEDLIPAQGLAAFVLELPGGTAARLGLGVGDRLVR